MKPPPATRRTDGQGADGDWETMLASLAGDRARALLEDAVGTIEQVRPPAGTSLDAVLRQLRSALSQLGAR